MNKVIWKFKLEICDEQKILMPKGAKILSVQQQAGELFLWALYDPEKRKEERIIYIYGTRNSIQNHPVRKFIGTVQTQNGFLVWHVFEASNER